MSVCVINIGFISCGREVRFLQIMRIYYKATLLLGFLQSGFFLCVKHVHFRQENNQERSKYNCGMDNYYVSWCEIT